MTDRQALDAWLRRHGCRVLSRPADSRAIWWHPRYGPCDEVRMAILLGLIKAAPKPTP